MPERADFFAHGLVAQRGKKSLDRRPRATALDQKKVVVLGRDGKETEPV